ncbi:hypothetical protein [Rheinheimera baltica]|uniref:hypothetical protein n=1 Tax=Rheinheimera baltica TaxID=67576 RepID=UPI0003FA1777|nr:hypothetical protein [Rheinheimera baltica]
MHKDENELATWQLTAGLTLFAILTVFGFGYFGYYLSLLLKGLFSHVEAVTLNKGAFYCLGAAVIGCMLLYFDCIELALADCAESPDRQKCRLLPQFSTNTVTIGSNP